MRAMAGSRTRLVFAARTTGCCHCGGVTGSFRSAKIFDRFLRRDAQPRARAVQATWGTLARGHFALVEIIHLKRAQSENESRGSTVDARKLRYNCPRRRTFARVPGVHRAKSPKSTAAQRRFHFGPA